MSDNYTCQAERDSNEMSRIAGTNGGSVSSVHDIGIIGGGWISTAYHLPILANLDVASVSYVADIDGRQARKATRGYEADAIELDNGAAALPDTDVVVLAIPVGVREEYIEEFGERGTAIFSEKPFAINREMHRRFIHTADRITCNYMRTCYSATVQMRHAFETGMLGTPERAKLTEAGKTGATGFGKNHFQTAADQSGGGILLERGCHSLSQVCSLFPDYDISVTDAEIVWHGDLDAEVNANLRLSDSQSTFDLDYLISRIRPVGSKFEIEYEDRQLSTDPFDPESPLKMEPTQEEGKPLTFDTDSTGAVTTHQAMYLRWLGFLSRLSANDINNRAETMLSVTRLVDDIYEAAE